MVKCCRVTTCRRLRSADFDLSHEDPSVFVKSQLPIIWGHWVAIVWNCVWCLLFTTILFLDVFYYTVEKRHLWLITLSNWACLLIVFTTLVEGMVRMCLVKRLNKSSTEEADKMVWCQKVQWTFYNINNVVSILTTIVYAALSEIDMSLPNVSKHVLTSVYVILNTSVISSLPVKIFHFYQSAIFLIFYAIFISIYQKIATQDEVFLVLDWNKPQSSAILLSLTVMIGSPLLHFLFYFVFLLRRYVFKKCSNLESSIALPATIQRDITATDVILEDSGSPNYIDVKPDVKDDIAVRSIGCANGDAFKRYDNRRYKSETDLKDYRLKNGLYCEFAKSSLIFHTSSSFRSTNNDIFDDDDTHLDNTGNETPETKGSQIIVVKRYKTPENENGDESDSNSSDCDSNASSDYLSQYITEDILAYL